MIYKNTIAKIKIPYFKMLFWICFLQSSEIQTILYDNFKNNNPENWEHNITKSILDILKSDFIKEGSFYTTKYNMNIDKINYINKNNQFKITPVFNRDFLQKQKMKLKIELLKKQTEEHDISNEELSQIVYFMIKFIILNYVETSYVSNNNDVSIYQLLDTLLSEYKKVNVLHTGFMTKRLLSFSTFIKNDQKYVDLKPTDLTYSISDKPRKLNTLFGDVHSHNNNKLKINIMNATKETKLHEIFYGIIPFKNNYNTDNKIKDNVTMGDIYNKHFWNTLQKIKELKNYIYFFLNKDANNSKIITLNYFSHSLKDCSNARDTNGYYNMPHGVMKTNYYSEEKHMPLIGSMKNKAEYKVIDDFFKKYKDNKLDIKNYDLEFWKEFGMNVFIFGISLTSESDLWHKISESAIDGYPVNLYYCEYSNDKISDEKIKNIVIENFKQNAEKLYNNPNINLYLIKSQEIWSGEKPKQEIIKNAITLKLNRKNAI